MFSARAFLNIIAAKWIVVNCKYAYFPVQNPPGFSFQHTVENKCVANRSVF